MTTTILNVPSISCGHCARTITTALTSVAGIGQVRVDLPAKQVQVEYDETQNGVERFKAILQTAGYPVEIKEELGHVQLIK